MAGKVTKLHEDKDGETRDGKMPDKATLLEHQTKFLKVKGAMSELKGDMSAISKNGANDHNIHSGAFKKVQELLRKDPLKLAEFLAHFDLYREVFGLDDQGTLDLDGVAAAGAN